MWVVTHEQGDGTSVALHSLEQPSPRRRSTAAIEATGKKLREPHLLLGGHGQ